MFSTGEGREIIGHLVSVGDIPDDVERAILRSTPRVVVSVYEDKRGKAYLGVVLYHK
jgi:hypothetical protein